MQQPLVPTPNFHLWKLICEGLDPEDILVFRKVCRLFYRIADSHIIWQRLYEDRWGQHEVVERALTRLCGTYAVPSTCTDAQPEDWKQKYHTRVSDERQPDWPARLQCMEAAALTKAQELIGLYESAAEADDEQQRRSAREGLAASARLLGDLLHAMPFHSGAYGLLARACAACGARGSARELLRLALELAADDPEAGVDEIQPLQAALERMDAQHGLIRGRAQPTGAFTRVLTELFAAFDMDHDGAWTTGDFDRFVLKTNGKPCPPAFRRSVFDTFATNTRSKLMCSDFISFFTHNALDDPQETWSDLAKHSYHFPLRAKKAVSEAIDEDEEDEDEDTDGEIEEEANEENAKEEEDNSDEAG